MTTIKMVVVVVLGKYKTNTACDRENKQTFDELK